MMPLVYLTLVLSSLLSPTSTHAHPATRVEQQQQLQQQFQQQQENKNKNKHLEELQQRATVSQAHQQQQPSPLLLLPREDIRDLWLSACNPLHHLSSSRSSSSSSSSQCCRSWRHLVLRAEEHLHSFWNPDVNVTTDDITRFDEYEPHWNCASRERIPGRGGDGPKWMCGVDTLNKSAVVYSFGSDADTQFEEGVRARTHTQNIYIFDPTLSKEQLALVRQKHFRVIESGLTKTSVDHILARGQRFPAQSLLKHMELLGHTRPSPSSPSPSSSSSPPSAPSSAPHLDVLKVDVESMEYRALQGVSLGECSAAHVRVGQLLIELHTPQGKKTAGITIKRLFHRLYSCGLLLFSKERNHWGCAGHHCVEFSFVSPSVAFADFTRVNPVCS